MVRDRDRLAGIEGLRAVAALSVLAFHVWYYGAEDPGSTLGKAINLRYGLVLFFVLSGFLLYRPWVLALNGRRQVPEARRFLWSRMFRILPAYWFVLFVAAWLLRTAQYDSDNHVGAFTDPLILLADAFLVQTYTTHTAFTGIGPAWTLGVELVFYLLLPLLGAAALRLSRGRLRPPLAAAAPALVLIGTGLVLRALMKLGFAHNLGWGLLVHDSFPAQADLFGFGMLVAVVTQGQGFRERRAWPLLLLAAAILLVVPAADFFVSEPGGFGDWACGIAFALILAATLIPSGRRLAARLDSRPLFAAGRWSYSVYLWHTPVLFLLIRWSGRADDAGELVLLGLVTAACVLAVSALTYRFVEAPARALGRRLAPWRLSPLPAPVLETGGAGSK